ncbi:MAG: 4-(cytidine 5'-diphospho)-2-C-methyl-D-erythritol kinase [Sulfurimonas sp.]|jgi:4-diphosphocytidyl-2-C-methyl-D-erythritol kinase|nr:4-(cytidine 5'-diphospho)-2-C-methyl-D-erythritol kinase [Sulfurimonadaceae bacterium]
MQKAYAKVNIFLKITGTRGSYHELLSRFMVVKDLYDELEFVKKDEPNDEFVLVGDFGCTTKQNTIYKAYEQLLIYPQIVEFFKTHYVKVIKNIPSFAGLGGGSSDAATFLLMCNDMLDLSKEKLATIGAKVGSDVPFFIYGYGSANVSGVGEIVEKFDEDLLDFDIITPPIKISTPKVYGVYRERFFNPLSADELKGKTSLEILNTLSAKEANDLLEPALFEYDELKSLDGYFFSGSGSSFFRIKR